MRRTSRTRFVILGLLGLSGRRARSGYELKRSIDSVVSSFWHESDGQLYPALKKLASTGSIEIRHEAKQGRRKTLYALTPKGRGELQDWLAGPVEIGRPRDELILKLFFGSEAEIPDLVRHVEEHRRRSEAMLQRCRRWEKEGRDHPSRYRPFVHFTVQAGIRLSEANCCWAEDTLGALAAMNPSP
jgi:PadR family transcriptional regulator AphA